MGTLCCTVWDKLTACTSYWHKEGPKPCLSFLSCAWAFNHVPLDSERVHIQLVGVLHPFLHTSNSAAQPLCPDWKGKSSFPGYFHGKLKASSMTFFSKRKTNNFSFQNSWASFPSEAWHSLTFTSSLLSLIIRSKVGNCEACDLLLI